MEECDKVEDLLFSRQPANLENYTFAAIYIEKTFTDPERKKRIKSSHNIHHDSHDRSSGSTYYIPLAQRQSAEAHRYGAVFFQCAAVHRKR